MTMKRGAVLIALVFLFPTFVNAAVLYAETSGEAFGPGDTFIARIRVDVENECLNVGKIVVTYPNDILKPVDFSRGGSLFSLWVSDPFFDERNGRIIFEGGIPGGYCGRIQGDPALTNILGKIIFSVQSSVSPSALITPSLESELFLADGLGTKAELEAQSASVTILPKSEGAPNAWLLEIEADDVPPESFAVRIESTEGVFNGNYYAVFSTVDKQSGIDHYEIFERGVWVSVVSPHQLKDQSLTEGVQVKAVDKAGNEQLGTFDPTLVPERKAEANPIFVVLGWAILILGAIAAIYFDRNKRQSPPQAVT